MNLLRQKFEGQNAKSFTTIAVNENENKQDGRLKSQRKSARRKETESSLKLKESVAAKKVSTEYELGDETESECEEGSDDEVWRCVECKAVSQDEECCMMECERCFDHYCTTCLEMSKPVYEYMQKEYPNTLWCCQKCCSEIRSSFPNDRSSPGTLKPSSLIEARIVGVENKLQAMEGMLKSVCCFIDSSGATELTTEVTDDDNGAQQQTSENLPDSVWNNRSTGLNHSANKVPNFRTIIREENEEARKEAERSLKRKKNLIFYRVPELEAEAWDERKTYDKDVIQSVLSFVSLDMEITDFHRLGKRFVPSKEDKDVSTVQTSRPLKVVLKNEEDRQAVLSNLNKLRNADPKIKSIRISPDMSLQEREEVRSLVAKAKNLNAAEKGDLRHVVRGKQIIQVRTKPPNRQNTGRGETSQPGAQKGESAEAANQLTKEDQTSQTPGIGGKHPKGD